MSLAEIIGGWCPGSQPEPWTWVDEQTSLYGEPHREHTLDVEASMLADGVLEPVLLGDDGRVWDGHHRVVIAMSNGIPALPVEHAASRVGVDLLNGAAEGDEHAPPAALVVLAGPIRWWWKDDRFGGMEHQRYDRARTAVAAALVEAGNLVYAPHMAFKGRWHEAAQRVNDAAIGAAHCVVALRMDGVSADGTAAEVALADRLGVPVVWVDAGASDHSTVAVAGVAAAVAARV